MSASLSLEFPAETKFPSVEEWFHAAEHAGFGLAISRDDELPTKLAKLDSWLVGVTYQGDETRFHFFVSKTKRSEPQQLWFECHDESEMTVATILGAVLMQMVLDGRLEDP